MLTHEQIDAVYREVWSSVAHQHRLSAFARAIEAEVRKDYEALIRQMHDAMSNLTTLCLSGGSPLFTAEFDRLIEAVAAARARLGEKT